MSGAAYYDADVSPTMIGIKNSEKSAKRSVICNPEKFTSEDISKSLCDKVNVGLVAY